MTGVASRAVGSKVGRIEGIAKVTGQARYAAEHPLADLVYGWPVASTIAKGRILSVDDGPVRALPGVLDVLTSVNAGKLGPSDDAELQVLQSDQVAYRGQVVGLVLATSAEQARAGAEALQILYATEQHDVVLTPDHPGMYAPDHVNPAFETDAVVGDVDAAVAGAAVHIDQTYRTPTEVNNPMEPHAATAVWSDNQLTVFDSSQGAWPVRDTLAKLFDIEPDSVRVVSEHVGGGFGSKGTARPHVVLAAMGARAVQRPVKVVFTRRMVFTMTAYRTPTIQRVQLGADPDGRLVALTHDVWEQTSTLVEFAEQTSVGSRLLYASPTRRTTHRLVRLDLPTPRWMRAPGEAPGMFALESAMDELAYACGVDPVEVRLRNEPPADPESGLPFSSRSVVECLHQGAERFGWADRDPQPGSTREGRWLVGSGVALSTYPARSAPSTALARAFPDGDFVVEITAADIGTGARTALTQLAADALRVPLERVEVRIGDSDYGQAMIAGGSMGTTSWGWAVDKACRALLDELDAVGGVVPVEGIETRADTKDDIAAMAKVSRHAFGAQFVEVRVDPLTGEVRVPRMVGVFGAGRIVNPTTARSQLLGGMTMGLSMALHEEAVLDPVFGEWVNHDFAGYHIAANADVGEIDVSWVDEVDETVNPLGIKGIGEIGIVGTAAAIANAVFHATGIRVRDLPIRLDRILPG